MADVLTKEQRSYCMSRIKGRDTAIEVRLKNALSARGIRGYRLNYPLRGRPDIVFPRQRIVIFSDGCFWHACPECYKEPKTNKRFWVPKIKENKMRDKNVNRLLKKSGWRVMRFWEHEIESNVALCADEVASCLRKER